MSQSPIDLPHWRNAIMSPVKPVWNYETVEAKTTENTSDGQIKTTHHLKIENKRFLFIDAENMGNVITLDGVVYQAQKIVFHSPAEHTIAGRKFDMEMQIIHYGQTSGDIAKQLVLTFLFEKKPGVYNKFLDDLDFFELPTPLSREKTIENNIFIPKIFYQSEDTDIPMMGEFSFYSYEGSLTSPPCTERTIHYIASDPIPIGTTALLLFSESLRVPDMMDSKGNVIISEELPVSNRAIQPLHGRNVYFYLAPKDIDFKVNIVSKPEGHFEKVEKKINNYYYVNNDKPSGMPGSMVVSRDEATGNSNNFWK